jgi:VanZ family protein
MRRFFQVSAWLLVSATLLLSVVPPSLRPVTDAPHNVEHFAIFLMTGFCFGIGYPYKYELQAVALIAFTGLIEIAQLWVPGRHSRLSDFVVDASAACIGIATAWLITRLKLALP